MLSDDFAWVCKLQSQSFCCLSKFAAAKNCNSRKGTCSGWAFLCIPLGVSTSLPANKKAIACSRLTYAPAVDARFGLIFPTCLCNCYTLARGSTGEGRDTVSAVGGRDTGAAPGVSPASVAGVARGGGEGGVGVAIHGGCGWGFVVGRAGPSRYAMRVGGGSAVRVAIRGAAGPGWVPACGSRISSGRDTGFGGRGGVGGSRCHCSHGLLCGWFLGSRVDLVFPDVPLRHPCAQQCASRWHASP